MAVDEKDLPEELREEALKLAEEKNKVYGEQLRVIREIKEEEVRLFEARIGPDRMEAYRLAQEELALFQKKLDEHDKETARLEKEHKAKIKALGDDKEKIKLEEEAHKKQLERRAKTRRDLEKTASVHEKQARRIKAANEEIANSLQKIETEAGNAMEGLLGINTGLKGTMKTMLSTPGSFKAFGTGILRALNPVNLMLSLFSKVIESTIGVWGEIDKASASFRKSTGVSYAFTRSIEAQAYAMRTSGVDAGELFQAHEALLRTMVDYTKGSPAQVAALGRTTALMQELGVSAQTTADIANEATKSLGFGFGEVEGVMREVAGVAEGLNRPFDIVAKDFASVSKKLAFYGTNVIGVFKKLSAQAKSTGLSVDQLLGVVAQFDTFEGAGQAVGKLNAIMGGPYLNSIDMLNASEEERVEILKRSMKQAGMNFKTMGKYEQQMIAKTLGVGVDEARKLFGAETEQQKMEALKKGDLEKRAKEAQSLAEKADQAMAAMAADIHDFLPKIHDALDWLTSTIKEWMDKFNELPGAIKLAVVAGMAGGAVGLQMAGGAIKRRVLGQGASAAAGQPGMMSRLLGRGKGKGGTPKGVTGKSGSFVKKGVAYSTKTGGKLSGAARTAALAKHAKNLGPLARAFGTFSKFLGPIGIAITVISGAIGPMIDKFKRMTKIFDMFKSGDLAGGFKEMIFEFFDSIMLMVPRILLNIIDQTVNSITGIINWLFGTEIGKLDLSGMFDKYIVAPLKKFVMPVIGFFVKMWTIQFKILKKVVQVVVKAIGWYFKTWWKVASTIFKGIKAVAIPVFKAWWAYVKFVFKVVTTIFKAWWKFAKFMFGIFKKIAVGVFKAWWGYVKFVFKVVTTIFKAWWKYTKFVFGVFKKIAVGVFKAWWGYVKFVFKVVTGAVKLWWEGVKLVFTTAGEVITGIWGGIKDAALAIWTPIKDGLTSAVDWIKEKAGAAMDWLLEKVQFWKGVGTKAKEGASNLVSSFVEGMQEQWEKLKEKIPEPLRAAGTKLASAGKWVGGKLGIGKGADDFVYQEGAGGRGKVTPINKKDVIMGAKRGGVVDNILKRMSDANPVLQIGKLMKDMIPGKDTAPAAAPGSDQPIVINVHVGQKKIDQIVIDALNSPTGKRYLSPYSNH